MRFIQKLKCKSYLVCILFAAVWAFFSNVIVLANANPAEGWQSTTPEEQGMRSQNLADMMEVIRKNRYSIDSVLIIRNGYLVLDAYFYPFSKGQMHPIHSCTKSIMSGLIGIAIKKGFIKDVNQPLTEFFSQKKIANMNAFKRSITLEHLLMMASGFDCQDSYFYDWKGIFEMKKSGDWAQYVLDLPMAGPPGKNFEYCNGVSYLLSAIIQNSTKMKTMDFAQKHLFNPLGISEIEWESSPQGIDIGYAGMWLIPHDMAKIGWLFLNRGKWGQTQILPASWIEVSTRGHIEANPGDYYGYHWWVNDDGSYAAIGYKGQFIFVVPEINTVVVFTGDLAGGTFFIPMELMADYVIPSVTSSKSLPIDMEETTRLDSLVKRAALPVSEGFVWLSREEGFAQDGIFRRVQFPKFMFEYPKGSKKLATVSPAQIMRMKTPGEVQFAASVMDIPDNLKLEDFGPKLFTGILQNIGSDIQVIANNKLTLKCGTSAYRSDIKWVWNKVYPITSLVVSSFKNNKCIYLVANPIQNPEKFTPIVESLRFE
jgi:CubicO group peptidase (beta-lactamase class C family)